MLHNHLSPIAFALGPISIRWYGIGFAFSFLFGEWIVLKMIMLEGVTGLDTSKLMIYALTGTVIGARLAHCLIYDPFYYLSNPWKIVAVWEGGLASHGGVLGLMIGVALATRKLPKGSLVFILDRASIPAAVGGSIVRFANFANSEILGYPTSSPLAVIFDAVDQLPRHPVQLYESAAYLSLAGILIATYLWTNARLKPSLLTGVFLVGISTARLLLEPFKMAQAVYEVNYWMSVGQMLSIPFLAIGSFLIVTSNCRRVGMHACRPTSAR